VLLNLVVNGFQCKSQPHRVEVGGEVLIEPLDLTLMKDGESDRLLNVENLKNNAPLAKLWVRDTGGGIPPEILPKIFQPYFTTKGPRQGTGLGLNIVHRLIKESSGALHVQTRQGEGTTFTVYLPASATANAAGSR
jgi:signal transduction histidine kinase